MKYLSKILPLKLLLVFFVACGTGDSEKHVSVVSRSIHNDLIEDAVNYCNEIFASNGATVTCYLAEKCDEHCVQIVDGKIYHKGNLVAGYADNGDAVVSTWWLSNYPYISQHESLGETIAHEMGHIFYLKHWECPSSKTIWECCIDEDYYRNLMWRRQQCGYPHRPRTDLNFRQLSILGG